MNWLRKIVRWDLGEPREVEVILHALRHGADNAEGLEMPQFIGHTFRALPTQVSRFSIPNYIESFLSATRFVDGKPILHETALDIFQTIWNKALSGDLENFSQPADSTRER